MLIGVLDIDSPVPDRFGPEEERVLREVAGIYVESLAGPPDGAS